MKTKKECSCYKVVKEDKVTLITECEICKKHRIKALKLIKEILVLANKLQEKQNVMKAVSAPIPNYEKGGKDSLFVTNDNKDKEVVLSPEQWSNSLKMAMRGKGITFSEAFEKAKTEDPILKETYEEIEKSVPFVHSESKPSEEYKKDHFYNLRDIFSVHTQEEIKKDPVLKMKAKLCLIEAIEQIDLL